jgi:hypothetical protein
VIVCKAGFVCPLMDAWQMLSSARAALQAPLLLLMHVCCRPPTVLFEFVAFVLTLAIYMHAASACRQLQLQLQGQFCSFAGAAHAHMYMYVYACSSPLSAVSVLPSSLLISCVASVQYGMHSCLHFALRTCIVTV